jgi:ferredoxin
MDIMRVSIDADKCIAAGHCVRAAPAVFSQNEDDGVVVLLQENPPPEQHKAVRSAARLCPAVVITIDESDQPSA